MVTHIDWEKLVDDAFTAIFRGLLLACCAHSTQIVWPWKTQPRPQRRRSSESSVRRLQRSPVDIRFNYASRARTRSHAIVASITCDQAVHWLALSSLCPQHRLPWPRNSPSAKPSIRTRESILLSDSAAAAAATAVIQRLPVKLRGGPIERRHFTAGREMSSSSRATGW